jgi:DNA-binding transcriptional regulator WhiA
VITNTPRLIDVGSDANRQRARQAGLQQAVLSRIALAALQSQRPTAHPDRWIRAPQHRISNPDGALAELGQTMTPPMTKHAYAALLRRALRGGGITVDDSPTTACEAL